MKALFAFNLVVAANTSSCKHLCACASLASCMMQQISGKTLSYSLKYRWERGIHIIVPIYFPVKMFIQKSLTKKKVSLLEAAKKTKTKVYSYCIQTVSNILISSFLYSLPANGPEYWHSSSSKSDDKGRGDFFAGLVMLLQQMLQHGLLPLLPVPLV